MHSTVLFSECLSNSSIEWKRWTFVLYRRLTGTLVNSNTCLVFPFSQFQRGTMSDLEDLARTAVPANTSESYQLNPTSVIVSVVFSLIFLLGTVGNSLVLAVLLRSGQVGYNTTNLFILNLSVADFFFIIFCVPFQATIYSLEDWVFGSFMCKAVHFFINLTMYASSFTLAAVSVDR